MTKSQSAVRKLTVPVSRAMLVKLSVVAMRPVLAGITGLYVVFVAGLFSFTRKRLPALMQST